jgi:serine/threonine protein kinase
VAVTEKDDPLLGTLVADRYRITRRIAEGGMGVVYLAEHEALRKQVALKVLSATPGKIDREAITRFEREAIAAANIKHPNIAEAMDFGPLANGGFYLVIEYVPGVTLRQLMTVERPISLARAIAIVEQVGAAIAAAHAHDVIHRDLKPENVIVSDGTDRVKVIDFGIAKLKSATFGGSATGLTAIGTVFGTPEYMSPEQVMGQAVDARADQYTLGVLAFELLAGRPPFQADDVGQVMMMHAGAPVPSLREHAPNVSAELEAVISRMLAKLPEERFESVAMAMQSLAAACSAPSAKNRSARHSPQSPPSAAAPLVVVPPYVPLKNAVVPRRSNSALVVGLSMVALLAVGGIVLYLVTSNEAATTTATRATSSASVPAAASSAPMSPELTSALNDWRSGKIDPAARVIRDAIVASPDLAEVDAVTKPLAAPLADEAAARALENLLAKSALGSSRAMASALADVAVTDDSKPRDAALALLRTRHHLLSKESVARVRLRDVESCEAFDAAKDEAARVATVATRHDLERLGHGDCKSMLRKSHVCGCIGPSPLEPTPSADPATDPGDHPPPEVNDASPLQHTR